MRNQKEVIEVFNLSVVDKQVNIVPAYEQKLYSKKDIFNSFVKIAFKVFKNNYQTDKIIPGNYDITFSYMYEKDGTAFFETVEVSEIITNKKEFSDVIINSLEKDFMKTNLKFVNNKFTDRNILFFLKNSKFYTKDFYDCHFHIFSNKNTKIIEIYQVPVIPVFTVKMKHVKGKSEQTPTNIVIDNILYTFNYIHSFKDYPISNIERNIQNSGYFEVKPKYSNELRKYYIKNYTNKHLFYTKEVKEDYVLESVASINIKPQVFVKSFI